MGKNLNTDNRLLVIIDGGRIFRELIDPEGVTAEARLNRAVFDTRNKRWKMRFVFETGETAWVQGTWDDEEILWVEKIYFPAKNGENEEYPVKRSKTILESLGDLRKVPVRLRRILSSTGLEMAANGQNAVGFPKYYMKIIDDALLWNIEIRKEKDPMKNFCIHKISFIFNERGQSARAEFQAINDMPEGRIILSADADVYGLGNKRVLLEKNLGMLRSASVECNIKKEGRLIPSLKAAYDLYEAIPVMYGKERRKKIGIGKPKAK